jgi:hypothetical protein
LVFAVRLNDPVLRRLWHQTEAAAAEKNGAWFAAAHHLAQLHRMADPADNLAALRVRFLRARTLYDSDRPLSLTAAVDRVPPDTTDEEEQALADLYNRLDWPPYAVPSWFANSHSTMLRHLRLAEERHLLSR